MGIPYVYSAPDEGYGEANENLGQFIDSFENTDNITVMSDVIRNVPLECIELNYTAPIGGYENYTEYTQIEPDNRVDIISSVHVAHFSQRDEDSMLYYDYGIDYFGDFEHEMAFESDFKDQGSVGYIWMISDSIDDAQGIRLANGDYVGLRLFRHPSSNDNRIYLQELDGGSYQTLEFNNLLVRNTLYYLTINKTGTAMWVKIYTDSDRTVLFDTLSRVLQNDYKMRYVYGVNSYNDGTDLDMNNDVYNLTFGMTEGEYDTDGYFITTDYLNYTQGQSLTLLTNSTLPEDTTITVEFSEDNSTWILNDWEPMFGGFESIDLRDLNYTDIFMRYKFTGPGDATPRLYQSRIVTTEGVEPEENGNGVTVIEESDAPWVALAIILSIVAGLLFTRIRR